jgi:hypothetical protein
MVRLLEMIDAQERHGYSPASAGDVEHCLASGKKEVSDSADI